MIKESLFVSSLSTSQKCNLLLTLLTAQNPKRPRSETMEYVRWHASKSELIVELEKAIQYGTECGL